MGFGRRTVAPSGAIPDTAAPVRQRTRRGGYWLGLLANVGVATLTMAVVPFISRFRTDGSTPPETLVLIAGIALLNLAAVAAVITLLVDLALRGLGWRRPWIYAVACALAVFLFYVALARAARGIDPVFALYVAVWPAAVGGWVMGLYRR